MRVLGLFSISLGDVGRRAVQAELATLVEELESTMRALDIRGQAQTAWERLHEPIQISTVPEIWLLLRPTEARHSGVDIADGIAYATASITVVASGVLGERPPAYPPSPLPSVDNRSSVGSPSGFRIGVPLLWQYDVLERTIEDHLRINERWAPLPELTEHYLTVHEVEVYSSGEHLAITLQFTADLPGQDLDTSGSVYLQGRPVVDVDQRTVSVEALYFIADTDNDLLDGGLALFDEHLRTELARALTYSFGEDYDRFVNGATSALTRSFGDNIRSTGNLTSLDIDRVTLNDVGIEVMVVSRGILRLEVGL